MERIFTIVKTVENVEIMVLDMVRKKLPIEQFFHSSSFFWVRFHTQKYGEKTLNEQN
jgi:hypothetical protein